MKSRNIIIKTLVILSAFLFISAAALSLGVFRANAEVPAGTFEIESSGVSLKLNETDGLRFVVKMDESIKNYVTENENVVLGFVIGPKQIMDNYTAWYGKNLLQFSVEKSTVYQVGGILVRQRLRRQRDRSKPRRRLHSRGVYIKRR